MAKKFRARGNKAAVLSALRELDKAGIERLESRQTAVEELLL